MVPFSERRHRIQGLEISEVIEGLKLRLRQHLEDRKNLLKATVAFRAPYRLNKHKVGRPDYPKPIIWELIERYLRNGTIPTAS